MQHASSINWLGFKTLYIKEVRRFLKVYNQTLVAPAVTAMLFLSVFTLAVGNHRAEIAGIPFIQFMVPGLIMMTMVQNAFANTSSSLTMGKVLGIIIDVLLPPLSAGEVTMAMMLGGITRGIFCGVVVALATLFFVPLGLHDFGLMVFYVVMANMMLSLLGVMTGILSDTFDQSAAITSYIITPLSFLSGTFYSVKQLPEFWQLLNHFNPFFYMIDGFRYSITGHHDGNLLAGMVTLSVVNLVLLFACYRMFATGFRLKT